MSNPDSEKFWSKVNKGESCWMWMGGKYSNGYGEFWRPGGNVIAHRFAYQDSIGPIPAGMQLDHVCHVRSCVNPDHLRPATNKQNNENHARVRPDNKFGLRGVGLNKRTGRYRSRVQHMGKEYRAGEHDTPEQAAEAARQLRLLLFTHNDADRKLGESPLVEFTTTEMRREAWKRIITCAGPCGRQLRNHHVPRSEAPDLVTVQARGMCGTCDKRSRA